VYSLLHRAGRQPFETFTAERVTNTNRALWTAISPDGKFLLNVHSDAGQESLRLRNIATGSDTEVVHGSGQNFESLAFSPDGNYIYFRESAPGMPFVHNLMRAPVLGGRPEIVAKDVDSNPTFSPDGRSMAFTRDNSPEPGKMSLLLANSDGSAEKVLFTEPMKEAPVSVAWSPDGKRIAVSYFDFRGPALSEMDMFDLASNRLEPFVKTDDKITFDIAWAPDGRTIYVIYLPRTDRLTIYGQIGAYSYPEGKFRAITNDLSTHDSVSVSADGKTLATVQEQSTNEIDIMPAKGGGTFRIVPGIPAQADIGGFDWAPDGQLLVSDTFRLLRMQPDGSNVVTLLSDPAGAMKDIASCDGGRAVALTWLFHGGGNGWGIWRADADGSGLKRYATVGGGGVLWDCSADGKWLYYSDPPLKRGVWRIPVEGGEPEALPGTEQTGSWILSVAQSPDGAMLAILRQQSDPKSGVYTNRIVVASAGGAGKAAARSIAIDPSLGLVVRQPNAPSNNGLRFTPDGKGVAFTVSERGVDNIWVQPLDGSRGKRITNFASQLIIDFRWSRDGKNLAVLRYNRASDAVLIHDTVASRLIH